MEACRDAGVELLTEQRGTSYTQNAHKARATTEDGTVPEADIVIAAGGLHSARQLLIDERPISSAYTIQQGVATRRERT